MEETIYVLHEHSLSKDVGNLLTEHCTTTTKNIVPKKCKNSAILANICTNGCTLNFKWAKINAF